MRLGEKSRSRGQDEPAEVSESWPETDRDLGDKNAFLHAMDKEIRTYYNEGNDARM